MEVEVFSDDYRVYFKAFVKDVNSEGILVSYESKFRPDARVPHGSVRKAFSLDPTFVPSEEQEVEVLSSIGDGSPPCWWPAVVKFVKDGFVSVHFRDWDSSYDTIVESSRVRRPNPNPPLSFTSFAKGTFKIPAEIFAWSQDEARYTEFVTMCGLAGLSLNVEGGALDVLGSEESVSRAALLSDIFFKGLQDKLRLEQYKSNAAERIQKQQDLRDKYAVDFEIDNTLLGSVIGKKGANILRARNVPGCLTVSIDAIPSSQRSRVTVVAQSQEALAAVRDVLEFSSSVITFPKAYFGSLVGKNFRNLTDITEKTGVQRISANKDDSPDVASLTIMGHKRNVEQAKLLMESYLSLFHQREQLWAERRGIDEELKKHGLYPDGREAQPTAGRRPYHGGRSTVPQRRTGDDEDDEEDEREYDVGTGRRVEVVSSSEPAGHGQDGGHALSRGRGRGGRGAPRGGRGAGPAPRGGHNTNNAAPSNNGNPPPSSSSSSSNSIGNNNGGSSGGPRGGSEHRGGRGGHRGGRGGAGRGSNSA